MLHVSFSSSFVAILVEQNRQSQREREKSHATRPKNIYHVGERVEVVDGRLWAAGGGWCHL